MHSVVQQRRTRGLSATVIDLGMMIGIGHMNQAGPQQATAMDERFNCMRVSEVALHDIFAQAILAGHPDSGYPSGLITGLRPASANKKPLWYDNPMFSHHRTQELSKGTSRTPSTARERNVELGGGLSSFEDLPTSLSALLAKVLQLNAVKIPMHKPLIQLGVDSLVAVEISANIFERFDHKVSILTILGGLSAQESKFIC